MKRAAAVIFLLLLAMSMAAVAAFVWWQSASEPPSTQKQTKQVVIKKGSDAQSIAQTLESAGVIKSALAFKIYTQVKGVSDKIQAGEFSFPTNEKLSGIVNLLLSGPQEVWVTIPEGFRREQIALRFVDTFKLQELEADTFLEQFMQLSEGFEGQLFPDTYLFPKDASASAVVRTLSNTFNKKVDDAMKTDITKSNRNLSEVITLASIIERETRGVAEKPIVAGILLKRIEAGWPIQADATVQYALASTNCRTSIKICPNWWPRPSSEDLKTITSVFNTYKNTGLPPAPIANPGLAAIRAAVYPEASDYWFYLHDEAGKIYYARTLDEHNDNISKYLN